jgi:NAD(P)-dependent dehydrogenase (short-subunit alcohol dehydrogenase family)
MENAYTLITGASSGMGAVCAKHLSQTQNLILASENLEMLEKVRGECSRPEEHILWHCDFANQRDAILSSLSTLLRDKDITVDKYVHFAGLTQVLPIKDFAMSYVDRIFNVNFFSIIEVLRALLKKQNKKALHSVVLISALVSQRGDAGNSIYAASKGAINALVYSLAKELAPQVRINAVMPGMVDTPMAQRVEEAFRNRIWENIPLGKGEPMDIVNYVEFLLSDKARWITGQTAFVDGGQSL